LCTLRGEHSPLLRTAPLRDIRDIRAITFSGGVSEFIYGRAEKTFGDLGAILAEEILSRVQSLGVPIEPTPGGIRATVIGASQYTIQVSGSTIYLSPLDVVPLRNVPVVMPTFRWDDLSTDNVRQSIEHAKRRFDLLETHGPVAIAVAWQGSATFNRIDAFCSGALQAGVAPGQPLVFAFDGDIGGLLGLHVREELQREVPIVSIDGLELSDFDFIDIGALIPSSGAVPVVIKSLIFPTH
jgi:ethanolamine utilization protein EutA